MWGLIVREKWMVCFPDECLTIVVDSVEEVMEVVTVATGSFLLSEACWMFNFSRGKNGALKERGQDSS